MADVDLTARPGCFDGVIPPVVATCSADGVPNVTHLSQLYAIDADHVALSNQFFGKTAANVAANGRAAVLVTDSQTFETLHLDLQFERTETSGPLFDALKTDIETIASLMQMQDVFRLRGADVYRVVAVRIVSVGARS